MLAQQAGDLEGAERHYEQQLALMSGQELAAGSSETAADYADVMKVKHFCLDTFCL